MHELSLFKELRAQCSPNENNAAPALGWLRPAASSLPARRGTTAPIDRWQQAADGTSSAEPGTRRSPSEVLEHK